jgi:hypothetical protein
MRTQIQQDPRIKRRLSCDLFFDGARHTGIVLNVSRSGLFVQTAIAAQPGSDVAIDLNGPSGESFEVDARVVWKRIVQSELMGVAHGGVGVWIKRASTSFYDFLDDIAEPAARSSPAASSPLYRYQIRVKLEGQPRSRALTVFAENEDAAHRQALQKVGEGWCVIALEEHDID